MTFLSEAEVEQAQPVSGKLPIQEAAIFLEAFQ